MEILHRKVDKSVTMCIIILMLMQYNLSPFHGPPNGMPIFWLTQKKLEVTEIKR